MMTRRQTWPDSAGVGRRRPGVGRLRPALAGRARPVCYPGVAAYRDMSRYSRAWVLPLLAAAGALALATSLTGCDAVGKLGSTGHYPAATAFTVDGRVTTVVIDAGSGSADVTAASRSTVA